MKTRAERQRLWPCQWSITDGRLVLDIAIVCAAGPEQAQEVDWKAIVPAVTAERGHTRQTDLGAVCDGLSRLWGRTQMLVPDLQREIQLLAEAQGVSAVDILAAGEVTPLLRIHLQTQRHPLCYYWQCCWRGERRPVWLRLRPLRLFPAHVASMLPRRLWGILRTGRILSMGWNWSPAFPGYVTLPAGRGRALSHLAAHEFGHILGLDDAYAAWYRLYDAFPDSQAYMMNSNREVQAQELAMALAAARSGRMQAFPFHWNRQQFFRGLKRELAFYARRLRNLWRNEA